MGKNTKIEEYDYFVIGAGSGGVRSARIAASHGAKVGIAENKKLGGTCVNVGCVPKKLFAYSADFSAHFEDASNYGWKVGKSNFNWKTLLQNKDKEITRLNGIYEKLLKNSGVDIISGEAAFIDDKTVEITNGNDKRLIKAKKILIATGGEPRKPAIPGGEHAITSDDAFHMKQFPENVVIMGGGYIAVEFAHILKGMGANVTLLYRGDLFLRGFDKDLRNVLADEMQKQGIKLCFNTDIQEIKKNGKKYTVKTNTGKNITTDIVLASIGRNPNTARLNLKSAGIATDKSGKIKVDSKYKTSKTDIYAVGDVCNNHNLTPVAIAEGHVLADTLFAKAKDRKVDYRYIPTAVFSHPPIGTVGLSEEEAISKSYDIDTYVSSFRPLKHTITGRDEKTFMKLVVDKKTDQVIGCHMIGADAPEIIQGMAIAINAKAKKSDFDRTIGIHPSSAEEFVTMRTPRKPAP
jgi:glutathione reductase (NADPH)